MKKAIVIGCPGSGKTTFSLKLKELAKIPVYHLDAVWHKSDCHHISRDEYDKRVSEIFKLDNWIIDGNYSRTIEERIKRCDTVFFFDLSTEECIEGAINRIGKLRPDVPWVEQELSPEFRKEIEEFPLNNLPQIYKLLEKYGKDKKIYIFKTRGQADEYLNKLPHFEKKFIKSLNVETLKNEIENIARYDLDNNNVYGASYCVYQSGKEIYKKHFGYSDESESVKVTDKTIYRLASMTKPITGVAVMKLVERGLLSLNDPVKKYLPEFEGIRIVTLDGEDKGETKTDPTILHMLTHTSGFGSQRQVSLSEKELNSTDESIKRYIAEGLEFEPFTTSAYSAFAAFDVVAEIIEKLTGVGYEEFLYKEIFSPCNMTDTVFAPTDEQWSRTIAMHDKKDGKNVIGETVPGCVFESFPSCRKLAGAGLASTLDDYVNFVKMLAFGGKTTGGDVITQESVDIIRTPYIEWPMEGSAQSWGLSVRVITDNTYIGLPVGSYGWSGAYGSHFWIDPENEIFAVYMKNSRIYGGSGNESAVRFEKAVYNSIE